MSSAALSRPSRARGLGVSLKYKIINEVGK